jgi:C-terminal processing protease CtpA/Prc
LIHLIDIIRAQLIFRNALLEPELELKIVRNAKKSVTSFFLNNQIELNQNTKRLGKIMKITLTKGSDGLGFKLASRDNPTGIANPIYVKTIFPKGAAIEDGRLRNGDRLLMVNSIDVTQMSLQETVGLLRETRIGETVHLCISRQHDGSLPKDLVS